MGPTTTGDDWTVRLLGALRIERAGRSVRLSHRQERLVVLLAIRSHMHRRDVAATLWPDSPDRKAALSLRATLHQLRESARGLVACEADEIGLMSTTVDASALCTCGDIGRSGSGQRVSRTILLSGSLLPGWDEEWIEQPRAHMERHRLDALEHESAAQLSRGNSADAVDLAERVIASDPLRESAHYLIVRAHLEAGNRACAIQAHRRLAGILRRELDVQPSLAFDEVSWALPLSRSA